MDRKIPLVALLLLTLCSLGCFTLDRQHNRRLADSWGKDLQNFRTEWDYYAFNLDRPRDKPQQKDRSILKQAIRDLRAAQRDWDYFISDLDREEGRDVP